MSCAGGGWKFYNSDNIGNIQVHITQNDSDIWSNSNDGYVSPSNFGQISNQPGIIKSIRLAYSGSETIYFQLHNKTQSMSFSNSTLIGFGYKISSTVNDLSISFDAPIKLSTGIAWIISATKFTYLVSSEEVYAFMQFRSIIE